MFCVKWKEMHVTKYLHLSGDNVFESEVLMNAKF